MLARTCDGDRLRQQRVHEVVCEHEVHDRVDVGGWAEVLAVVAAEAHVDAVVVVQHAGHAVEAEAVEPAKQRVDGISLRYHL